MKIMLGALATLVLAAGLLTSSSKPAEARCWWNGYRTVCNGYGYYNPTPWPRYPGWQQHSWCYYHPRRCGW